MSVPQGPDLAMMSGTHALRLSALASFPANTANIITASQPVSQAQTSICALLPPLLGAFVAGPFSRKSRLPGLVHFCDCHNCLPG